MHRRNFIKTLAVGSAGVFGFAPHRVEAAKSRRPAAPQSTGVIDTSISLSRWPFRRLPLDETKRLVTKLKSVGVVQAWAGSFDALLHKNLAAVNEALAGECQKHGHGMLLPFGAVNPKFPDWEEDLRRCHEHHEMPGIRLFPNYHGYRLDDPAFVKLLAAAESRGLIIQVALSMEDERVQHPLMHVPNVNPAPLLDLLAQFPKLKIVLLNWFRAVKGDLLLKLAKTNQAWFDIAMVEGLGGIDNLRRDVPLSQIVFGSHAPFFYMESAQLKLRESPFSQHDRRMIEHNNAKAILVSQG